MGSTAGGMPVDICWTTGGSAATGPVEPDAAGSPVLGPMAAGRASGPLAGSICTTGPASGGSGTRCCGGRVSGAPRPRRRGPASGDRWTTGPGGVGSGAPRPRRRGAARTVRRDGSRGEPADRRGVTVGHGGDLAGNLEHGRVGEERCTLRGVRQARRPGRERPGVRHLGDRSSRRSRGAGRAGPVVGVAGRRHGCRTVRDGRPGAGRGGPVGHRPDRPLHDAVPDRDDGQCRSRRRRRRGGDERSDRCRVRQDRQLGQRAARGVDRPLQHRRRLGERARQRCGAENRTAGIRVRDGALGDRRTVDGLRHRVGCRGTGVAHGGITGRRSAR